MSKMLLTEQAVKKRTSALMKDLQDARSTADELDGMLRDIISNAQDYEWDINNRYRIIHEIEGMRMDGRNPDAIIDWILDQI